MTSPGPRVVFALLLLVLSGCASMPAQLGIRPDEPAVNTTGDPCAEYATYSTYAQELQEAYHSRASQNRAWIYVAGIVGLGVAAAAGGLAIAAASATTIGLLAISGGFTAGGFAAINNSALAVSYTVAANTVDEALKTSRGRLMLSGQSGGAGEGVYTDGSCVAALSALVAGVSDARTHLEVARTDNAAGALQRAKDQQKLLNETLATVQAADPTRVTLSAVIVDVSPGTQPTRDVATSVTLTVRNIRLDEVAPADVKVVFGTREPLPLDGLPQPGPDPYTYLLKFTAPAVRPDPAVNTYAPVLLVGKSRERVVSQQGKTFTYLP